MKYFLWCLITGLSIKAYAEASLSISELKIQGENASVDAQIDGRSYSCAGGILLGQFSVLRCGDQRQAQVEFQSFVNNTLALVAFYESGRQVGALFIFEKSADGFQQSSLPVIFTPGFGSLNQFQKFVVSPMLKENLPEEKVFEYIGKMMMELGADMTLTELRNQVSNRVYEKWMPKPPPPPPPPSKEEPKKEEPKKEEPKSEDGQEQKPVPPSVEEGSVKPSEEKDAAKEEKKEDVKKEEVKKDSVVADDSSTPEEPILPEEEPLEPVVAEKPAKKTVMVPDGSSDWSDDPAFDEYIGSEYREVYNPYGYDLRRLSLEEIEELRRRGLIEY